jgi:uncharacterized FlgJ-related protein
MKNSSKIDSAVFNAYIMNTRYHAAYRAYREAKALLATTELALEKAEKDCRTAEEEQEKIMKDYESYL